MIFLSSNHYSADDQVADVLSYLSNAGPVQYATHTDETAEQVAERFTAEFPEYNTLTWSGSWVDTEASGVDVDYMSWVTDWIESNTAVTWWEGEPVILEDSDSDEGAYPEGTTTRLDCGCLGHNTRMTQWGFHCEAEQQGYCNFEHTCGIDDE